MALTKDYLTNFQTVRPFSLPEVIYTRLRAAILTGELPPGQRLVEMDIAEHMGTSQGPVREALQRLENDGLVEKQPRSSTFVTSISREEVYELFQVRALVEKFAIQRTACTISPGQLEELQALLDVMYAAAHDDDLLVLGEADMAFHRRICEWSGSGSLVRAWTPLYSQIQRFVTQNHRQIFPSLEKVAGLHQPILEALRRRDAGHCGQLIEEHILYSFQKVG